MGCTLSVHTKPKPQNQTPGNTNMNNDIMFTDHFEDLHDQISNHVENTLDDIHEQVKETVDHVTNTTNQIANEANQTIDNLQDTIEKPHSVTININ